MKRVNSGSMKFRNYSANCCMLVKFFKLSEGKICLSIDLNPIFHSFNKHHLSTYHVAGPPPDVRSTKPAQTFFSWSL